jgi:hypothetical protein
VNAYGLACKIQSLLRNTVDVASTTGVEKSVLVCESTFTMDIQGEGKFRVTVEKMNDD